MVLHQPNNLENDRYPIYAFIFSTFYFKRGKTGGNREMMKVNITSGRRENTCIYERPSNEEKNWTNRESSTTKRIMRNLHRIKKKQSVH